MKRKSFAIIWTSLWFTLFVYLNTGVFTWNVLFFFLICVAVGFATAIIGDKFGERFRIFAWDDKIIEFLRSNLSDRALLLNVWLLILLFWIPAWLAFFPGTFGYDTPVQFAMYMGDIELTSANPLMHTLVFGGIVSLGNAIFGSYQAGFILFTILQIALLSNCMANMTLFLIKRQVPLVITLIGLLWTITHPVVQVLNFNSTKDILCGVFFAYFVMAFWDMIEEKEKRKVSEYVKFFFFGLMVCLMRNAILFLLAALLVISLFTRLKDKKVYLTLLGVIVCAKTFSFLCGNVAGIPGSDMKENLCIPIQQMAAVAYASQEGKTTLSEEDLDSLGELFTDIVMTEYDPYSADYPKSCFRTEAFKDNPGKYISLYFRLGTQNPDLYQDAFKSLILPYWHMEKNPFRKLAYSYTFPELNQWNIRPQYFSQLARYQSWLIDEIETPYFPFWRQPGLCIWLLAALSGLMIARKEQRGLLKLLPIFLYFAGILLGPVALLRYLYPVMLTVPLLFGMLFKKRNP